MRNQYETINQMVASKPLIEVATTSGEALMVGEVVMVERPTAGIACDSSMGVNLKDLKFSSVMKSEG